MSRPRAVGRDHEVVLPDGTVGWQHWVDHRGPPRDGPVVEFQAIGRDITDRKRAEEANRNLAHASRLALMGELTASIAHEINQPLGAILANADAAELLLEAGPGRLGRGAPDPRRHPQGRPAGERGDPAHAGAAAQRRRWSGSRSI